jgi:hypothetical protein
MSRPKRVSMSEAGREGSHHEVQALVCMYCALFSLNHLVSRKYHEEKYVLLTHTHIYIYIYIYIYTVLNWSHYQYAYYAAVQLSPIYERFVFLIMTCP